MIEQHGNGPMSMTIRYVKTLVFDCTTRYKKRSGLESRALPSQTAVRGDRRYSRYGRNGAATDAAGAVDNVIELAIGDRSRGIDRSRYARAAAR